MVKKVMTRKKNKKQRRKTIGIFTEVSINPNTILGMLALLQNFWRYDIRDVHLFYR